LSHPWISPILEGWHHLLGVKFGRKTSFLIDYTLK